MEERGGDWVRTWAFKISETRAKSENYGREKVSGTMKPTPEYPGCPYCGAVEIIQCPCGKMSCYHGGLEVVCPWCEVGGRVQAADKLEFEV